MVVRDLAKVEARVRFPYPAPVFRRFRNNSIFSTALAQFCAAAAHIRCGTFSAVLEFPLLAPMLAYLCGPIEFANGGGKLWRRKLAPFLREQLGHRLYDPAEDEKKNLTDEEMAHFREWKSTEPERFRRAVRKIIHFDLDLIENKADYLICYWDDPTSPSGGTAGRTHRGVSKGNSGLFGDSSRGRSSKRLDARLRGPNFYNSRTAKRISSPALRPREANATLEGIT